MAVYIAVTRTGLLSTLEEYEIYSVCGEGINLLNEKLQYKSNIIFNTVINSGKNKAPVRTADRSDNTTRGESGVITPMFVRQSQPAGNIARDRLHEAVNCNASIAAMAVNFQKPVAATVEICHSSGLDLGVTDRNSQSRYRQRLRAIRDRALLE
ncbi:hypothetical protein J6590_053460 [Homalodisca vitripennis]|nr:hypothetical protein J6590_053460 [Homalodisca vitripennis]